MEEEKPRMEKGDTIVLYPSLGMGHLISMVELGKRILELNPPFSITILLTQAPFSTGSTALYVRLVESSFPSITFIHLPPISLPIDSAASPHPETLIFRLFRLNNPVVHQSLLSLSLSSSILAILYDGICGPVLDIASQLHIPCYCFFTSPASCLAAFLYFPTLHRLTPTSFEDLQDTPLHFPGLPPVPASALPLPMLDRNDEAYDGFLQLTGALSKPAGILINTFDALEPRALRAISKGSCVPDPTHLLHRAVDRQGEGRGRQRLPSLARLAAELQCCVLVLWQLGALLRGSAHRDCYWVGEERAEVLMGRAQPSIRESD